MRRLFWLMAFIGIYVWASITGNEEMFIQKGKLFYKMVVHWLEDAEIDFHLDSKNRSKGKNRPRRWD